MKASRAGDELSTIRVKIVEIIALNPNTYESLQSYRVAPKRERMLVAREAARAA